MLKADIIFRYYILTSYFILVWYISINQFYHYILHIYIAVFVFIYHSSVFLFCEVQWRIRFSPIDFISHEASGVGVFFPSGEGCPCCWRPELLVTALLFVGQEENFAAATGVASNVRNLNEKECVTVVQIKTKKKDITHLGEIAPGKRVREFIRLTDESVCSVFNSWNTFLRNFVPLFLREFNMRWFCRN